MDKCLRTGEYFEEAFLCLQNTPCPVKQMSPTRLCYGRIVTNPELPQIYDGRDKAAGGKVILQEKGKRKEKN